MKRLLALTILLAAAGAVYGQCGATPPSQASGYTCQWQDTFSALDLGALSSSGHDWYQGVYQWSNTNSITNPTGSVDLNWVTGNGASGTYMSTSNYAGTSGRSWKYGYFEASMKFNSATGNWPAFWMFSNQMNTAGVQTGGELDGFEWQSHTPGTFYGTVHAWSAGSDIANSNGSNAFSLPGGVDLTQYHTYGYLWTSTSVSWYFDNSLMGTYSTTSNTDINTAFNSSGPMYLILDEVPGCNWAYPCSGQTSPLDLHVQWVHVFQQATSGSCPASAPSGITTCYYIAAGGSDSNTGTDEAHPWLHAPGMYACSGNCAAVTPSGGKGFIFKGGDTWHFGNSGASPYTGGGWDQYGLGGWGSASTCTGYAGTVSGCVYYGVDPTWYSGGSWSRPVMNGDNATNTSLVGSCTYQVANSPQYTSNVMISQAVNSVIDNFEFTGICSQNANPSSGTTDAYIAYFGSGTSMTGMGAIWNSYFHGWTATTTAGTGNNVQPGTLIGGGANGIQEFDHIVIDGSDSNPGSFGAMTFPTLYRVRDSMFRYTNQIVGQGAHDVHDNIFEHFYNHNAGAGSHTNIFEINYDNEGGAPNQPANTPNVFYNNIVRHDDSSFVGSGQVHLWFCPTSTPEYWFNNLMYDVAYGNDWDYAGPGTYSCSNTGGQYMFNNTLVDVEQPCSIPTVSHGGQYLTVLNEHLINTPFDSGSTACTGAASSTNIAMSDATATTQGYTTGSSGTARSNTCANDSTMPCKPTSGGNSTVAAGANHIAYCNTLATYTSEPQISTTAANACAYATTDGCTYNTSTHTMSCPAQTAIARPASAAWDAGAYQYTSGGTTYTLSTSTAGTGTGTITGCAGNYASGAGYSCTVTATGGSTLASVSGCGGSGTTTYAGTMPASNCTVTATFNAATGASSNWKGLQMRGVKIK